MSLLPSFSSPPLGVYVSAPTFFMSVATAVGSLQAKIDIDTQIKHSLLLARSGIRGLVLLGSIGESIHLSRAERTELVAGVRKGLADAESRDFPLMVGVLSNSIDDTLECLEDYAKAGAQWGLVLTPGYFGKAATQHNLREWFTIIADHSPLPILIYNCPAFTNQVFVEAETYRDLSQHPNVVGCKMTHNDVSTHLQVSSDPEIDHSKFRVFSGFSQQLAPVVLFGAAGVIDGLSACYPKTVVHLMNLATKRPLQESDLIEIQTLQRAISRAKGFTSKTGLMGIREAIIRKYKFGALDGHRLPLNQRTSDETWASLAQNFLADIENIEANL